MTSKVYFRKNGAAATTFTDMTDRVAYFDDHTPVIQMGNSFQNGGASQGGLMASTRTASDETFAMVPHMLVRWTENASGSEIWLAQGRMSSADIGRGGLLTGANIEQWAVIDDCNEDLRGLAFTEAWVRPEETDYERLVALAAYTLNGASSTRASLNGVITYRPSTTIVVSSTHLAPNTNTVTMPAKTYPVTTQPQDVLNDCISTANKVAGVVLHHAGGSHLCLQYILENDNSTYASVLKISDQDADKNEGSTSAPVCPPIWDLGRGRLIDGQAFISGLVTRWGPAATSFLYTASAATGDANEYWNDAYDDPDSVNVDQATARAAAILAYRSEYDETNRCSILLNANQTHLVAAGMSIQIKAAVTNTPALAGTYRTRRIVQLQWEPIADGRYYAHMQLNRAIRRGPASTGAAQPAATTPTGAPECAVPEAGTVLCDSSDIDWPGSLIDDPGDAGYNATAAAALGLPYRKMGGSGGHTGGCAVSPGSGVSAKVTIWKAVSDGDAPWEQTSSYYHRVNLHLTGAGMPTIDLAICNQFFPAGSTNIVTGALDIPVGYDSATLHFGSRLGGWAFTGELDDIPAAPDDIPFCLPAGTTGSSPYFARSDDPRFTADDQHLTSRLSGEVLNNSGGALAEGDVVIADPTADGAVTTTASAAYTDGMVGMVETGGDDQEPITVLWAGVGLYPVTVTSAATAGDFLFTSTTPGAADPDATRAVGAVGKIISLDDDGNPLLVEWWGNPDSGSGGGGGGGDVATDAIWDAAGDLAVGTGADTAARLALGGSNTRLVSTGATAAWRPNYTMASDPLWGSAGDIAYGSGVAVGARLALGGSNTHLVSNGALPLWRTPVVESHDHKGGWDGGAISGGLVDTFVDFSAQTSTPATPSAGTVRMFGSNSDLYSEDSTGRVSRLGSYGQEAGFDVVIDGGSATITTGIKCDIEMPFDLTLTAWRLLADASGSIQIDVWKDTLANFPPVDGDSITNGHEPKITSATNAQDNDLSGWTGEDSVSKGDILRINVDSVTSIQRVTLAFRYVRRGV